MLGVPIPVLDKGHLALEGVLGDDLAVVNAARVSFAASSDVLSERDEKLIRYLAEHKHNSPFYHPQLTFTVKAPISAQRQWFKHKIGTAENSESTRYTEVHSEFYLPSVFRAQSKSNKQGSEGAIDRQLAADKWYKAACMTAFDAYRILLELGVAKELAREVLPLCTYTSWTWTASLFAVAHFINLRNEGHAQYEIRQYAKAMLALAVGYFPISLKALCPPAASEV